MFEEFPEAVIEGFNFSSLFFQDMLYCLEVSFGIFLEISFFVALSWVSYVFCNCLGRTFLCLISCLISLSSSSKLFSTFVFGMLVFIEFCIDFVKFLTAVSILSEIGSPIKTLLNLTSLADKFPEFRHTCFYFICTV